jgi:PAS domain S-box-containing protein
MTNEIQQASLTWRVTPDLMCILDRNGCFLALNPAWQDTLGWARVDMLGRPYLEFLHPDDIDRSVAAFEVVKRGEPVLRFENRYQTRLGDHRWLHWVAVPDGGRFYCTARDVTEDKGRIDRIAQQQAEAELREQFMAVLGHDLLNPLAAVSAGTSIILRNGQDEKSVAIIRQMQSSVGRMTELINNLMDLTRVRLGSGLGLQRVSISDLGKGVERVIEEIRLASPGSVVEARLDIAEEGGCDVARVLQVVSNLLANAVTYGASSEPIQFEAQARAGRLRIAVSNKGEKIPDIAMVKLFQPFFRTEVRASKQGLGLGLYICSEIAKAHGGTLKAASSEAETRFTFDIPL